MILGQRGKAALALVAYGCLAFGCSNALQPYVQHRDVDASDPLAVVPADFTLDVRVEAGRAYPWQPRVEHRTGRWILFPSGELHYGTSVGREGDQRPPQVRILSSEQIAGLWRHVQQAGMTPRAAPDDATGVPGEVAARQPIEDDALRYAVWVLANEQHRTIVRSNARDADADGRGDGEGDPAPSPPDVPDLAMAELVRHLAALAWVPDEPPQRFRYLPRRYDFGPDPYARYRRDADQTQP